MMPSNKTLSVMFLCVLCLSMTGCTYFRDYVRPNSPVGLKADDFTSADKKTFEEKQPEAAWWKNFNDDDLNALIADGLNHNLDIQIALTNVFEARAVVGETKFDRFPTVEAFFDYRRTQLTEEGVTFGLPDRTFNAFDGGVDIGWELDLFGRVSNRVKFARANAKAREADLQSAYVMVFAEIASAYIDLRGAQYRLDIAERNAKNQRETLKLTERLSDAGSSTELDVARAQTQYSLTQSTIPPLEAQVFSAIYRLSVLTGRVPRSLEIQLRTRKPLPSLPESIGVGSPNDLLRRRPDIRSAEHALEASIAQYNLSVAEIFPTVDIIGNINFSSTSLDKFARSSAVTYSVGPGIRWAAFNLGRVFSRIEQDDAATIRTLKSYQRTVLRALEEVQTTLVSFKAQERRLEHLRDAAFSSKKAADLAEQRFEAGIDGFLDVLDAERTLLESEDAQAVSEIQTVQDLINIYRALGGGWSIIKYSQD